MESLIETDEGCIPKMVERYTFVQTDRREQNRLFVEMVGALDSHNLKVDKEYKIWKRKHDIRYRIYILIWFLWLPASCGIYFLIIYILKYISK